MNIYLLAFRGTAGFTNPKYKNLPALIKVGHVGISFEGSDRIFGFHPTQVALEKAGGEDELLQQLRKRQSQDGALHDNTEIFKLAHSLHQRGERTQVLMLTYEFPEEDFKRIKSMILEMVQYG